MRERRPCDYEEVGLLIRALSETPLAIFKPGFVQKQEARFHCGNIVIFSCPFQFYFSKTPALHEYCLYRQMRP